MVKIDISDIAALEGSMHSSIIVAEKGELYICISQLLL